MKITNVSGDDLHLPAIGKVIPAGDTVDVADDLGKSLLDQPANWQAATQTKPAKSEE